MSDSQSPDRKRSLDDESSDTEDRNARFKRQAVSEEGQHDVTTTNTADDSAEEAKPMTMRAIISMKEAGMIIGKNGKNVADIRDSSGARVTVSENVPGAGERVVTVIGPLDTVAKAFALCATKILEEQPSTIDDVKQRPLSLKVLIPHARMGSIIGKAGAKIKEIQEASGSKLTATEEILPHSTERVVIVAGVIDSIHIATYHIGAVLQEHTERTQGTVLYKPIPGFITGQVAPRGGSSASSGANSSSAPRHSQPAAQQPYGQMPANPYYPMPAAGAAYSPYGMMPSAPNAAGGVGPMTPMMPTGAMSVQQIYIPNEMVGAIIGKGGSKINEIRTRTGCNIKIADPVVGATERLITVTGMPEANSMALYMLYQRLEMEKQKTRA
ncbi:hypothetical protein HDU98_008666 [Podochytrium sp. JEL0797]|nr:hypothetical protein HDU98_008666 [Podochytrium sp. JEL0797]